MDTSGWAEFRRSYTWQLKKGNNLKLESPRWHLAASSRESRPTWRLPCPSGGNRCPSRTAARRHDFAGRPDRSAGEWRGVQVAHSLLLRTCVGTISCTAQIVLPFNASWFRLALPLFARSDEAERSRLFQGIAIVCPEPQSRTDTASAAGLHVAPSW